MHSEVVRRSKADVKSKYLKRNNSVRKKVLSNRLSYGCSSLMYACQQGDIAEVLERLHTKLITITIWLPGNVLRYLHSSNLGNVCLHQCLAISGPDDPQQNPNQIQIRDRRNKSALHYCAIQAVASSNVLVAAASIVVAAPELLESVDEDGFTPLHLAVIQGNLAMVNLLLANKADVNAVDKEGHSVVHWATVCGEVAALRAVLAADANIAIPDINGGSPLHYAAQMCGAVYDGNLCQTNSSKLAMEILEILLSHPQCNVDVQDKDGRQPLLWAASAGSAKAVTALVKAGARVESADKDGLTALHCAASRGHTECIDTLISLCGAPTDLIDANGCTALHYAVTLGHADATSRLLDLDADPNRQDRKGRTPSHCGCAKGQLETVKLLKDRGANLWLRNAKGDLPLHEAASSGRRELVEWLLEQRSKQVNTTSNDGRSMLHIAAYNDYTDICKVLLDYGAEINSVYSNSKSVMMTPLDCALQKGHRSTAKFLQSHGGLPAGKLRLSSRRENPFREAMVDAVRPLKDDEFIKPKKLIVYMKQSDSDIDEKESYCECLHPTYSREKRCRRQKFKRHVLRRRTSSCGEPKICRNKCNAICRSKSNIEIRFRKSRERSVYTSESDDEDSCENCCYHKYLKEHVIVKNKYIFSRALKDKTDKDKRNKNMTEVRNHEECSSDDHNTKKETKINSDLKDNDLQNEGGAGSLADKEDVVSTNLTNEENLLNLNPPLEDVEDKKSTVDVAYATANAEVDPTPEPPLEIKDNKENLESAASHEDDAEDEKTNLEMPLNASEPPSKPDDLADENKNLMEATEICNENREDNVQLIIPDAIDEDQEDSKKPDENVDTSLPSESKKEDTIAEEPQQSHDIDSKIEDSPSTTENTVINNSANVNETDDNVVESDNNDMISDYSKLIIPEQKTRNSFTLLPSDSAEDEAVLSGNETSERKSSFQIIQSDDSIDLEEEEEATPQDEPITQCTASGFTILPEPHSDHVKLYPSRDSEEKLGNDESPKAQTESLCSEQTSDIPTKSVVENYEYRHAHNRKKRLKKRFSDELNEPTNWKKDEISSAAKDQDSGFEPSPRGIYRKIPEPSGIYTTHGRSCSCRLTNRKTDSTKTACNMSAVTRSIQRNIRRYYMERKIFQHLLELKSLQIRSNKLNEAVLVKRAVDDYHKSCIALGGEMGTRLRRYNFSEYSFKNFELFLYETLKSLQKPGTYNFQDINELYEEAERRLSPDYGAYEKALQCTTRTHRCFHATHAYTGIPCAAYIPMMNHHTIPKFGFGSYKRSSMGSFYLPKILTSSSSGRKGNVALELSHGKHKQLISLPSEKLDSNKRYYVTFEVKGTTKRKPLKDDVHNNSSSSIVVSREKQNPSNVDVELEK
uniref:ANK_REP_REGION domain-containing protein n=1 Tax=Glossina pallidipes TaxID=7398 RepID=A0A1B0AHI5_GLOPL